MKKNRWVAPALFVVLLSAVGGIYWQLSHAYLLQKKVTAHIEVKVLDDAGLPVTGAKVFERDVLMGQTDSYGEWRRFARYHAGDSLPFRVAKRTQSGVLEITKNFAIPVENNGETVELKATLMLLSDKAPAAPASTPIATSEVPTADVKVEETLPTASFESTTSEPEKAAEGATDPSASSEDGGSNSEAKTNETSALTLMSANLSKLSERQRAQNEVLSSDVFMKLLQHFKQKPLKQAVLDGWLFSLQHLGMGTDVGLILMNATNTKNGQVVSVVKTFEQTPENTSNALAAAATWAVENGSKGLSPRPDWKKHQMQILGAIGEDASVFVAGFPATRDGANMFSFFAARPETANVTVIEGGQIAARGKAQLSGEGKPLIFALEKGKVAIRQ